MWTGVVMGRVGVDCEWCGEGEEGWVRTVSGVVMGRRINSFHLHTESIRVAMEIESLHLAFA